MIWVSMPHLSNYWVSSTILPWLPALSSSHPTFLQLLDSHYRHSWQFGRLLRSSVPCLVVKFDLILEPHRPVFSDGLFLSGVPSFILPELHYFPIILWVYPVNSWFLSSFLDSVDFSHLAIAWYYLPVVVFQMSKKILSS